MRSSDRRPEGGDADTRASLVAALIDVSGLVPDECVDWDTFHSRLSVRAALPLARLRAPRGVAVHRVRPLPGIRASTPGARAWWEHAARWSRVTVSASLAASVVLGAVIRLTPKTTAELSATTVVAPTTDPTDRTRAAFESAVVGRAFAAVSDSALMPSAAELLMPLGSGGDFR